ncbi:hypothetical protein CsSME_00041106 [Camellia sinensis var. sinensis]
MLPLFTLICTFENFTSPKEASESLPEHCGMSPTKRQNMSMHFQSNLCTTTLLIMFETQRSIVLDPRAINHAFQCMMAQDYLGVISRTRDTSAGTLVPPRPRVVIQKLCPHNCPLSPLNLHKTLPSEIQHPPPSRHHGYVEV